MVFSKATSSNGAHRRGDGIGLLARALQAKKGGSQGTWQGPSRPRPAGPHSRRPAEAPVRVRPRATLRTQARTLAASAAACNRLGKTGGQRLGPTTWGATTGGQEGPQEEDPEREKAAWPRGHARSMGEVAFDRATLVKGMPLRQFESAFQKHDIPCEREGETATHEVKLQIQPKSPSAKEKP